MKFEILLTPETIIYALLAVIVFIPILKWLLWKIFAFDKRVETILSQKKSSEVRVGKIAEALSPIIEGFPVEVQKRGTTTVFLGQPIDYVHFDPDRGVTFIEVKSGESRLSTQQKKIREAIEDGRVFWEEFQVK